MCECGAQRSGESAEEGMMWSTDSGHQVAARSAARVNNVPNGEHLTMNLSFSLMVIVVALTLVVSPGHAAQASDGRVDNLMQRDLNDDGVLTEDEAPPGMFSLLDSNNDGQADRAELVALMARISKPFSWVNPPTAERTHPRLAHATFLSPSMDINVGYNLPTARIRGCLEREPSLSGGLLSTRRSTWK